VALADLERMKYLGVTMKDRPEFYEPADVNDYYMQSSGKRKLAVVTQNVDSLHERAGSKDIIHLHGRGGLLKCMQCGKKHDRNEFHQELEDQNQLWLADAKQGYEESTEMRPDGDALVKEMDYNHVHVPNCPHCKTGFYKPDVVFFGDTVPKGRVALCQDAVEQADGILVVGSSLAVHSAFRHIRAAVSKGTSVAIVNVGETRAEAEGLDHILKIEAPASDALSLCVQKFAEDEVTLQTSSVR
jgi:NAD-dependent deacetylase sirtuin 4